MEHFSSGPSTARRLIPDLIVENVAAANPAGLFPAAGLYLDLSGFTQLTESLIEQGTGGVEKLALTMETWFAPLIASTFDQGGFVAGFAGDSFSALFPAETGEELPAAALRALAAAEAMQWSMRLHADQAASSGDVPLRAKIGLGLGDVEWAVVNSADNDRAVYLFKGSAVAESALAENAAAPGEIVSSSTFQAAVAAHVTSSARGDYFGISGFRGTLPEKMTRASSVPGDVDALARFVPESVIHQSTKGEFRQILSLFINLEGTPDAEDVRRIMERVFPLLQRYGGLLYRINYDDKGCSLNVFWGAPSSKENDLRRALAFILDMRAECHLPLRAGLTYRMAYAGFMGSPLYEEYTCYSRGVNLASRLMTSAPWGEIWLDGEVASRAEISHHLDLVGQHQFKGFGAPLSAYRLRGARQTMARSLYSGAIVGREAELRQLTRAMEPLQRGQSPGVYAIIGEAGIGKSRLAHEFLDQGASSVTFQVLRCQTDEILQQPLNPFRYGLRSTFGQSSENDDAANLVEFEARLATLINATPEADLAAELQRTRAFIGHVIDLHWPDSLYEQVDPQLRAENTFSALKTLFKAMSLQRPLVIHLEDAHALDRDSRAFIPYLMRNVLEYPLALFITTRETPPEDWFDRSTQIRVRHLQPLNRSAMKRLAEVLSAEAVDDSLISFVAAHSEGNPLFVEQMLLYLERNTGRKAGIGAETTLAPIPTSAIPTDVRSLLIARLDQLPAAVRESTQIASVLGREFETDTLARMVANPEKLGDLLEQGAMNEIWYPLAEGRYLFRHALLRDAAYDMQLHSRRQHLHAQAAFALAQGLASATPSAARLAEIAYHYDAGGMTREAGEHYGKAGRLAAAAYSNEQAVDYFTRALDLTNPTDLTTRYALLEGREQVYGLLGQREKQDADLAAMASALVVLPDNRKRAELLLRQAAYSLALGDYEKATERAQSSAAAAAASGDLLAEGRAYHRLGRALWQQGRAADAQPHLKRSLALVREGNGRIEEAECLYDLGMVGQYLGDRPTALGYALEASELFEAEQHAQGLVRCSNLIGMINYSMGRFTESAAAYADGLLKAREIGWRYAESTLLLNSSHYYFEFGDYERARQHHEEALAIARETADLESESVSLDTLGLIAYCLGENDTARQCFREGQAVARQIGNERSLGYLLTHYALVLAEDGAASEALAVLDEALDIRRRLGNEAALIDTQGVLTLALARAGELRSSTANALHILDWMEANGAEGLELPVKLYLICHVTLTANDDPAQSSAALVDRCITSAYQLIQERAQSIDDVILRRQYLHSVPFNREVLAIWQRESPA